MIQIIIFLTEYILEILNSHYDPIYRFETAFNLILLQNVLPKSCQILTPMSYELINLYLYPRQTSSRRFVLDKLSHTRI